MNCPQVSDGQGTGPQMTRPGTYLHRIEFPPKRLRHLLRSIHVAPCNGSAHVLVLLNTRLFQVGTSKHALIDHGPYHVMHRHLSSILGIDVMLPRLGRKVRDDHHIAHLPGGLEPRRYAMLRTEPGLHDEAHVLPPVDRVGCRPGQPPEVPGAPRPPSLPVAHVEVKPVLVVIWEHGRREGGADDREPDDEEQESDVASPAHGREEERHSLQRERRRAAVSPEKVVLACRSIDDARRLPAPGPHAGLINGLFVFSSGNNSCIERILGDQNKGL